MNHLCYFCLVFVMLSRLFIAALWSPEGKGLTSWLSLVIFIVIFLLPIFFILGQLWYLIVSIPDPYHLSFFAWSVTCLTANACLAADPGVASSISARPHTFIDIYHKLF